MPPLPDSLLKKPTQSSRTSPWYFSSHLRKADCDLKNVGFIGMVPSRRCAAPHKFSTVPPGGRARAQFKAPLRVFVCRLISEPGSKLPARAIEKRIAASVLPILGFRALFRRHLPPEQIPVLLRRTTVGVGGQRGTQPTIGLHATALRAGPAAVHRGQPIARPDIFPGRCRFQQN